MSEHCPGPWKYGEFPLTSNGNVYIWAEEETVLIAEVSREDADEADCKANAALIAAAPCLLAACREALQMLDRETMRYADRVAFEGRLRAVITRAEDVSQFAVETEE